MTAVVHGGLDDATSTAYAARGIDLVDLSASLNPYGPHPRVVRAARAAQFGRYPESHARSLRAAYAAACGLSADQVLAGNGSSELIYLAARAFLRPGDTCLAAGPAFGEYAPAATAAGAVVAEWRAIAPCFQPDVSALLSEVARLRPRLVVICNPANPAGVLVDRQDINRLTEAVTADDGRLLVDEAYAGFAWPCDERVAPAPGRLVLHSLTKLHAIPGLRIGFLLGLAADLERVATHQPPWAVSAPATAAALQALEETAFADRSRRKVAATRTKLQAALGHLQLQAIPSHANFVLVRTGDARGFRERLMERGFVVRDCTSFKLPEWVRVAVPHERQLQALVAAIAGAML